MITCVKIRFSCSIETETRNPKPETVILPSHCPLLSIRYGVHNLLLGSENRTKVNQNSPTVRGQKYLAPLSCQAPLVPEESEL
jgi:hypothetical protein